MPEIFFTLKLTENEHEIVSGIIQDECVEFGCELVYYRKFKNGHVPMWREVKIKCDYKPNLNRLVKVLQNEHFIDTEYNYHKEFENFIREKVNERKRFRNST